MRIKGTQKAAVGKVLLFKIARDIFLSYEICSDNGHDV